VLKNRSKTGSNTSKFSITSITEVPKCTPKCPYRIKYVLPIIWKLPITSSRIWIIWAELRRYII